MCKTKCTFTASIGINRISSCQVLIMTYWLSESVSISVDMAVCWSGVFSIHPHLRLERADKLQKKSKWRCFATIHSAMFGEN